MKVLEFYDGHVQCQVHILNPGDTFQGFGGSNAALIVKETPSIIVRRRSTLEVSDHEYGIKDPTFWSWLNACLSKDVVEHECLRDGDDCESTYCGTLCAACRREHEEECSICRADFAQRGI